MACSGLSCGLRAAVVLLVCFASSTESAGTTAGVNPIRKVVTMLQMMQKKVKEEGEREQELFEKFLCYCKTGGGELTKSISDAEVKIPQLESDIEAAGSAITQLEDALETHKRERAEAKAAISEAVGVREKDAAAFAKESSESKANIAAMEKAIPALEAGMAGSFLQSPAAQTLARAAQSTSILVGSDQQTLLEFLTQSQGDATGYAPASGEIVGILKQMHDTFRAELAEMTATEEKAKSDHAAMMAAKEKEIAVATKAIEDKSARLGNTKVELVKKQEDLEDTSAALAEDKKLLKNLEATCAKKKTEYEARVKTRAEENLALADTIRILNDDDALDLFKKTLPSSATSFVQVQVTTTQMREEALQVLRTARVHGAPTVRLDLLTLALRGKKVGFEKVIAMVDDMVTLLQSEQEADDSKIAKCQAEFDKTEDSQKTVAREIKDLETAIEEGLATQSDLSAEIAALVAGIKELDAQVAEATEQRKEEHAEFVETLQANNAAKELLEFAKNRLNKFYNKKLYVAPPKRELSEADRITLNNGGTIAPTAPPGGIAGTGITALDQEGAPSFLQAGAHAHLRSAPDTFSAYQKQTEASGGVIAMIDLLKADLTKEIQEMEFEEQNSQSDYEQFMEDGKEKRAVDAKSVAEKEGAKADLEGELHKMKQEKKSKEGEAMALAEYMANLHADCDWIITNHALRKEARANEIDALKKAKSVLSGADYSLLQTGQFLHRRKVL